MQQLELKQAPIVTHELGWHREDLSAFEFHLVVPGRSIMKKRSMKPRTVGGHASIGPSSEYTAWERAATKALIDQWGDVFRDPIPAGVPINARIITYLPNRSGWPDLSATYEGPQDVMEAHKRTCRLTGKRVCKKHAGVIANDVWVCGHVGSDRRIDPERPRVEITLTRFRTELQPE